MDGYVSLEVSPYLAHDAKATVAEAHRLWDKVGRENVLIKVPATPEGLPAIRQLIAEGINVNITLLFSQKVYEQVAGAYIEALEELASARGDIGRMASVASFFVSRIDTSVDALVESRLAAATSEEEKNKLQSIPGRVAIANAKLTYQKFKEIFSGKRWQALAAKGAACSAVAVGQHEHEKSQISRRALRGRTDRPRHGQHHAAGHHGCISRAWAALDPVLKKTWMRPARL